LFSFYLFPFIFFEPKKPSVFIANAHWVPEYLDKKLKSIHVLQVSKTTRKTFCELCQHHRHVNE